MWRPREGNGCYSACVYVFAGGVVRTYDGLVPLGVHQFSGSGDQSSAQATVAIIGRYLDEMGVDHRLLEAASSVSPDDIQPISVATAREWDLDNSQARVTRPGASAGPAAADLFRLRSECNALGEHVFRTEDEFPMIQSFRSWTSRYDMEAGRCYVQIYQSIPLFEWHWEKLYDAQKRQLLAIAHEWLAYGAFQQSESGIIVGIMENGKPSTDTIGNRTVEGHAAYLKAKAFIDDHMQENR